MLVVHIGLGKTATTVLQKHVFPELAKIHPDINFNNQEVMQILRKSIYFSPTEGELSLVRNKFSKGRWIISLESLVNWNPRYWEEAADQNLSIFGSKAEILITVRDTGSYLRSVYQQMIHQRNIKAPERFFVDKNSYDLVEDLLSKGRLEYFDVDSFEIDRLLNTYKERFDVVRMVPLKHIREFEFLREPFSLTEGTVQRLRALFNQSPISNRSYSHLGMLLTFGRERFLNALGMRSIGSDDRDPIDIYRSCEVCSCEVSKGIPFKSLSTSKKWKEAPVRTAKRLARLGIPNWRKFIQNGVDRIIPYKMYRLPETVYRNCYLEKRNDNLISRLPVDGIL